MVARGNTTDANMNVTAVADTSGGVVERYDYDPYGQVTVLDDDWTLDSDGGDGKSDVDNQILFAGYRFDPESGLYHVRFRMYHPTLGRWLQRDPLGYIDGLNLYQGMLSNPLYGSDPTGLDTYVLTRELGGRRPMRGLLTHSFIYTTSADGTVAHTYSWGNTRDAQNRGFWHRDRDEDIAAAEEDFGLVRLRERNNGEIVFVENTPFSRHRGDRTLDPYIEEVFEEFRNGPAHRHEWRPWNQCKTEAGDLLEEAIRRWREDQQAGECPDCPANQEPQQPLP